MTENTNSSNSSNVPEAVPGAKMQYLIKRKPTTSREELVAHWFASHMPPVIKAMGWLKQQGRPAANRYLVTLYNANRKNEYPWDGMAQLWWDTPQPMPEEPFGVKPTDTFQQKIEPYVPWASTEYVIMDGSENLKFQPNTLNDPYPCTRSGFFKISFLVGAKKGTDFDKFFSHWLSVHVPNVRSVMEQVGGFRYTVSHSIDPLAEPYAGLAELYFPDESGWTKYVETIKADGMEEWVDGQNMLVLSGQTEMIGVP